ETGLPIAGERRLDVVTGRRRRLKNERQCTRGSVSAIDDGEQSVFVRRRGDFPARTRRDKRRGTVDVPVVRVVLDELIVREQLAVRRTQGNERIRIQIFASADGDVVIRRGIARGHVEHTGSFIEGEGRPEGAARYG